MPVLMSFGAPLLIAVAVVAMQQRQGTDRSHALPALLVGLPWECAVHSRLGARVSLRLQHGATHSGPRRILHASFANELQSCVL